MIVSNYFIQLFAISLLLFPTSSLSQELMAYEDQAKKIKAVAMALMKEAKTAALITLDEQGRPRVRTMSPFPPDSNFVVWFGTNPYSRKVEQIKKDPSVTLYYTAADETGYVMIHGRAELVNDPEEKQLHWKEEWEAFYPNRNEAYLLIKVSPEWMEVISETHGVLGDEKSWTPPIIRFE
ncbi:MAG: pyridoxamine 5'-phosphate oxidase family protein [Bacteroidota bacterium]